RSAATSSRGEPWYPSARAVMRSVRSARAEDSEDSWAASSSMAPVSCPPSSGANRPREPGWGARRDHTYPQRVLNRLDLRGSSGDLRGRLPRPAAQVEPPIEEVRALLADVRERGDEALRELTARFDRAEIDDLRVPPAEVAAALDAIDPALRAALEVAHRNITAYHEAQRHPDAEHRNGGIVVRELQRSVDRAACYVPSALAPLVSTVLMMAIP